MPQTALKYSANILLAGLFAYVLYSTAWLCDDAYISYRTVENWVTGHGLTWNPGERVQAFTHPLWLFINAFAYSISLEGFLTFITVAMTTSMIVFLLFTFRMALTLTQALLGTTMLLSSRAYMDYATSGLENPLSHLLLLLFLLVFLKKDLGPKQVFFLALISGLGVLNRMDTLLLYAPAMAYLLIAQFSRRTITLIALGYLPFITWELFSLIYYGALVPNTAYAKLGTGLPDSALALQGLHYYNYTLLRDPATLPVIAMGLLAPLFLRKLKFLLLALGLALYLVYIIKIGGDFMGGRFFAAPLFLAVCILVRSPMLARWKIALPLGIATLTLTLLAPHAPFTTGSMFGNNVDGFKDGHGVGDERRFWYNNGSLTAWSAGKEMPAHSYVNEGKSYRKAGRDLVKRHGSVGFRGFFAGPKVHIVDHYALTDPLLARMPARYNPRWRIGHFTRHVPAGYEKTISTSRPSFQDPDIATFNGYVKQLTQGPLWTKKRWATIYNFHRGTYDHLIDKNQYRFPKALKRTAEEVSTPKQQGTRWNASGNMVLRNGKKIHNDALWVTFPEVQHSATLELSGDHNDGYHLVFLQGEELLGTTTIYPDKGAKAGLAVFNAYAPKPAIHKGYDAVIVFPIEGDGHYSLGHLRAGG